MAKAGRRVRARALRRSLMMRAQSAAPEEGAPESTQVTQVTQVTQLITSVVAALLEFLPGTEVIKMAPVSKAWRDAARTALTRGRWRPVFETLKVIKADEGPPPAPSHAKPRRRPADRDAAATALFKEAWRLDGALTLKVITEGGVGCPRTAAADFLTVVEPDRPDIPIQDRHVGARPSEYGSIGRVVRALESVATELLTETFGGTEGETDYISPIYNQWHSHTWRNHQHDYATSHYAQMLESWQDPSSAGRFCMWVISSDLQCELHRQSRDRAVEITQGWADRDKASRFVQGWCDEAETRQRRTNDAYWRLSARVGQLDKPGGPLESFRRGELTEPPPDVCIEGLEVLKPGTQEYEDKFGEQDRRTVRRDTERILRMEIEAYGFDYDEELARVRENSPGATSLSDDDLFWRLAEVWHRAMNS